jgi:(4S)-4-hydroxy-5-phosphonooxypentane-2,3-dione isomerase
MGRFAVVVDIRLAEGVFERFRPLILENARRSLGNEPGCRRFDVLVPKDGADRVVLYEVYDDRAAFDAHRNSPHFVEYDRATTDMIRSKSVAEHELLDAGAA